MKEASFSSFKLSSDKHNPDWQMRHKVMVGDSGKPVFSLHSGQTISGH